MLYLIRNLLLVAFRRQDTIGALATTCPVAGLGYSKLITRRKRFEIMTIALGLLILRIIVGGLLIGHGTQKLFGWFGGKGFDATITLLAARGFRPAWFWGLLGGAGEAGGGLLLAIGFLNALGAVAIFAAMLMAIAKFHWSKGVWSSAGGYEYPLVLLVVSVVIGLVGPGIYSLDGALHIALPGVIFWLGILAAIVVDAVGISTSRPTASGQPAMARESR
jgi:putative oxidoreductase